MSEASQPILTVYDVTITATITKTYRVEAENWDKAIEQANQVFSIGDDGIDELYSKHVESVCET